MDNTITLKRPVEHKGHTYTTLTMREPLVRDSVMAQKPGGTDAEKEVREFSLLCDVPPAVIESMTRKDYGKLQAVYQDFLS